ncbi:hypothetical protein EON81_10750 [bacterium]|nr:MAG: hypothetical protein EON81_10750 [bacterium]
MAGTVVEELLTRFSLDASGYQSGAQGILSTTSRIGSGIKATFGSLAGYGTILGTALLAGGKAATDNAIRFDTLERSLTAVTGSAERAKKVLSFVDELSVPSVFGSEDLANTARLLEAFGLQTEKYLPSVESLATVFGGSTEKLEEFARALGYIRGQRFGEAIESLGQAGISRDDLKKLGLQFDKQGSFLGEAQQLLDAVTGLTQQRYGGLSAGMATGPAARIASTFDNIGRAGRQAGVEILGFLLPALDKTSDRVEKMVKTGELGTITHDWMSLANGGAAGDAVVNGFDRFLRLVRQGPTYLREHRRELLELFGAAKTSAQAFTATAGPLFTTFAGTVDRLAQAFNALPAWAQQGLVTGFTLNKVSGGLLGSMMSGAMAGQGAAAGDATVKTSLGSMLMRTITGPIGMIGGVLILGAMDLAAKSKKAIEILEDKKTARANVPWIEQYTDASTGERKTRWLTEQERDERYKKELTKAQFERLGVDPDLFMNDVKKMMEEPPPSAPAIEAPSDPVMQIVRNTAKTADAVQRQLDLQRVAIGGGELARQGLTAYDMSGIKNTRAGGRTERLMRELLASMASEMVGTAQGVSTDRGRIGY